MRTKISLVVEPVQGIQRFELIAQEVGADDKLWPLWRVVWDANLPTNIKGGLLLHHVQQVLYNAYAHTSEELHKSESIRPPGF